MWEPEETDDIPPLIWTARHNPDQPQIDEAPPALPPWAAGAVLVGLYHQKIVFRIESHHHLGFTWVWVKVDEEHAPRALIDEILSGGLVSDVSSVATTALKGASLLRSDWHERGTQPTLEGAAAALAAAVAARFPHSSFADWWDDFLTSVRDEEAKPD